MKNESFIYLPLQSSDSDYNKDDAISGAQLFAVVNSTTRHRRQQQNSSPLPLVFLSTMLNLVFHLMNARFGFYSQSLYSIASVLDLNCFSNLAFRNCCKSLLRVFTEKIQLKSIKMTDSTATYANMLNYANLIGSATKAHVLVTSYYDYWAGRMKDYLIGLDKDLWRSVTDGPHTDIVGRFVVPDGEEAVVLNAADLKKLENDERAMRELRSGLGPDVSHHIADAKSAKEMNFKQEENESLEVCYERFSNMIYTLDKYGETRSQHEINIKFLYSIRKEWRPIMLMVKSYENIEKYKLAALYNLLKSHEPDVVGRRSEMAGSGPLALVSKEDEETSDEDIAAYMVDDNGETVALYAANNRRFKKPFLKNNSGKPFVKSFNKSNFNSKPKLEMLTPKDENLKSSTPKPSEKQASESSKEKVEEKKVSSDSGYDCNYCHRKNHFTKDCMLRKQNEKKPQVKDETYYARKMKEVRVRTKDLALMAADDHQGSYQVWSSDSDDDEVRKPTHSAFMAYDVGNSFPKDTSENMNEEEMLEVETTAGLGFKTSEMNAMLDDENPKTWSDDTSDDDEEICLMANETRLTIPEQVSKLLSTFKIPASQSTPIINEITRDCSVMHKMLIDVKNRETLSEQEILSLRGRVESLKLALEKSNLRISLLEENREKLLNNHDVILKQRNIFCETAKRLYAHITRIYHSADVCNVQHRQLLPFIEFKLKEVDSISYECESIVSGSEVTNSLYKLGLISVEKHVTADNLLKILPQEIPILKKAVPQIENKEKVTVETAYENDSESDSDMEEIDCLSMTLLKSSSVSESPSKDISQLSSEDKGKTRMGCEPKTFENKEIVKLKLQISDSCRSYDQYLKDNSKRLVHVACIYPKISYFKNDIFVKPGGSPFVENYLEKLLEEDNSTVTEEGFFSSSKMVENEMNERMESVPLSLTLENSVSKPKISITKTSVQKPQILKRPQILQKSKPAIVITKPTQKPIASNLKSKQPLNLVKRKTPFGGLKQDEAIASTSGTKPLNSKVSEVKNQNNKPSFTSTKPNFPNPKFQKPTKKTFSKGNNLIDTYYQWLDKNLDVFKDKNLSLNDFKLAYEEYLCTSTLCSSISRNSTIEKPKQNWKRNDLKENLTARSRTSKSSMNSKLSSKKKTSKSSKSINSKQKWVPKICNLSVTSDLSNLTKTSSESCSDTSESCSSHEASENLINLNANEISEEAVMSNERYDSKWYMDSGCSRHMIGKKEYLKDYMTLDDAGNVRFGNNETCPIRGYGKITNGQFTISRVAFVEGLKHNLVSIYQLVVGTGNDVTFNNQGSVITKEETKEVLLKSERKGSMFPLNLKPVTGGQSLCLLSKTNSDVSWLWHRRLAHLNFKDLNKLVAMDLVRGIHALKFDTDTLCSACEHGKQTKQRHPTVINPKITEPLSPL
ncbi:hypothetical protein L2E82_18230 [Cichorium intybus]|uniref:Uncharacterized protein n=1 Tax=Cichorium intybus TaxID=13427 RepID=A0ACB9FA18_CICIN|nr:hypothetical protein L2E82_18230 [Cichorium intybus]